MINLIKDVTEAQNIEKNLVSMEERLDKITEVRPNHEDIFLSEGTEKQEATLENVKMVSVAGNSEGAPGNGLTVLAHISIPPGATSVNPDDRKTEPLHLDATNNFVHLQNENRGLSGRPRKRKPELKGPVISSWTLRSKSQEIPKAPQPTDPIKEGTAHAKKKRGRKKKQMQKSAASEFSRTRSHLRYLLHRISYEQNLIDVYSAEGWRGQSLDKLKPEKELEKAKSHILRYKLKIRALFQQLDLSLAMGKLPESLFDSQGKIDSEDIFCAKCGSKDLTLDNDIILCDGACERGFHQFCLEPPLLKNDIPPGDESWLCPGCDCKADCIDILKDIQGIKISILDSWEKIFPEAAAAASGQKLNDGSGSTSDDSEDEEYDPDKPDRADADENIKGDESSSDDSSYFSASDDVAAPINNNEKYVGLPSDDSEDDDFDPSAPYQEEPVKQDSLSSDFTSDSEDLEALLKDETMPGQDVEQIWPPADKKPPACSNEETSKVGRGKRQSLKDELAYLVETSVEPVSGRRHVERLNYKKLLDLYLSKETCGDSSSDSSDEDFSFDDTTTRKRTKTNRAKTEVKSSNKTPITTSNIHAKDENQTQSRQSPIQTCKNSADGAHGGTTELSAKVGSASTGTKRSKNWLGEATTQRLYASFNENQYPNRAVKENLAKELGLTVQQVSKWFDNTRWSFNHRPGVRPNSTERPPESHPAIGASSIQSNQNMQLQEASAIPAPNDVAEGKTETYGNSSSDSSDEDFSFDDTTTRKRTNNNREKTEVKSSHKTPITMSNIHAKDENQTQRQQSPIKTCKNSADEAHGGTMELSAKVGSASTGTERLKNRLGEAATQRLYASFNENQYPARAVKENLAKELGLTFQQVSKWFDNTRWSFNHRPGMGPNSAERPPEPHPTIVAASTQLNQNVQLQEASAIPAQNHVAEENSVTNTSGEHSGTQKHRKRKGMSGVAVNDNTGGNKTQEQNTMNDAQSPQLCSSQRQTRRSTSVS